MLQASPQRSAPWIVSLLRDDLRLGCEWDCVRSAAGAFRWHSAGLKSVSDLELFACGKHVLAVLIDEEEACTVKEIHDAVPEARVITCGRHEDAPDGVYLSLLTPLSVRELTQAFGFIWAQCSEAEPANEEVEASELELLTA